MFSFFKSTPLVDQASEQWIFDCFGWALTHFDADVFRAQTQLVLPQDHFFPSKATDPFTLSEATFRQAAIHSGMGHWPFEFVTQQTPGSALILDKPLTRGAGHQLTQEFVASRLPVHLKPQLVKEPQMQIADYALALAHYLCASITTPPPGGDDYWPQARELLAHYLGFGIMLSNTAFTFRGGGCSSCHNSKTSRAAYLSEEESVFALAVFARLKLIPNSLVTAHLKSHLKGQYKRAAKMLTSRTGEMDRLNQLFIIANN